MPLDTLMQSSLKLTASRYDWLRASPDMGFAGSVWRMWTVVSWLAAAATSLVIIGVLRSKSARRNSFNLYIAALCLPDFIFSFFCTFTCLLSALSGHYYGGARGCAWQSFYVVFGFAGSMWMQAVIAIEIRRVLRRLRRRTNARVDPRQRLGGLELPSRPYGPVVQRIVRRLELGAVRVERQARAVEAATIVERRRRQKLVGMMPASERPQAFALAAASATALAASFALALASGLGGRRAALPPLLRLRGTHRLLHQRRRVGRKLGRRRRPGWA